MIEFILTVALLASCWYGYKAWIIRSAGKRAVPTRISPPVPEKEIFEWPDKGHYDFEIVGESFYQQAIQSLTGEDNVHVGEKEFKALLILDDNNPHDNEAVRVVIGSLTVGHLSRENARSFRRRLGSKKLTGQTTACKAIITGGDGWDGKESFYGICLNIKEFDW